MFKVLLPSIIIAIVFVLSIFAASESMPSSRFPMLLVLAFCEKSLSVIEKSVLKSIMKCLSTNVSRRYGTLFVCIAFVRRFSNCSAPKHCINILSKKNDELFEFYNIFQPFLHISYRHVVTSHQINIFDIYLQKKSLLSNHYHLVFFETAMHSQKNDSNLFLTIL